MSRVPPHSVLRVPSPFRRSARRYTKGVSRVGPNGTVRTSTGVTDNSRVVQRNYSTASLLRDDLPSPRSDALQHGVRPATVLHEVSPATTSVGVAPPRAPATPLALVDFNNARAAFKNKSSLQIIKAVLVFRLSGFPFLVNNADVMINIAAKMFGNYLVNGVVVRHTFFSHFCGGETVDDLKPFLHQLRSIGVGAILDYAAEADVPPEVDEDANDVRYHRTSEGCNSARIYDYHGESECDANAETVMESIRHASHLDKENAFCAMKLTALCKPKVLEKMSQLLMAARRSWVEGFAAIEAKNRDSLLKRPAQEIRSIVSCPIKMQGVDLAGWKEGLARICVNRMPTDAEAELMFDALKNEHGTVDYLDYTRKLTLEAMSVSFDGAAPEDTPHNDMRPLTHSGAVPLLDEVESKLLRNMVRRIDAIARLAVEEKVNVMIDAEQTYMQVAIDHFATMLQRIYNVEHPRIYNTYQCYLTYSKMRILNDLERAKRENWKFAGKIVRGAYMVQERALAEEHSYTSPIFATEQDTHRNFDECVSIILSQMPQKDIGLMIGSHNQKSIEQTIKTMDERGIDKSKGGVYFGQLLGMADHLTFPLGQNGYNVYKYVPYGPVHEVMPYLIRRAQENSSMKSLATSELSLLQGELKRRALSSVRLA